MQCENINKRIIFAGKETIQCGEHHTAEEIHNVIKKTTKLK
jgi:hypothetical protein